MAKTEDFSPSGSLLYLPISQDIDFLLLREQAASLRTHLGAEISMHKLHNPSKDKEAQGQDIVLRKTIRTSHLPVFWEDLGWVGQ